MTRNDFDELERRLADGLHDRVDHLHRAPLDLADVRVRARGIRRNRMIASGVGLAAALAIAVPAGLAATGGFPQADHRPPVLTQTPEPQPVPRPVVLDADAPRGAEPAAAWLERGSVLHLGDRTIELAADYRGVHVLGDRLLGVRSDDSGALVLDSMGPDGSVIDSEPVSGVASSADRSTVGWVSADGATVTVAWDAGEQSAPGPGRGTMPVAVTGGAGCPDGCRVWFEREGEAGGSATVDLEGVVAEVDGVVGVNDAYAEDLYSATTSVEQAGSCGAVIDGGAQRFETCEHTVERFSPDGRWVLATDAYLDGAGQGRATILDARSGAELVTFDAGEGLVVSRTWEDAQHALLTHYSFAEQTWRLFRVGLDGSVEQAVEPDSTTPDFEPAPWAVSGSD